MITCGQCGQGYATKAWLFQHTIKAHSGPLAEAAPPRPPEPPEAAPHKKKAHVVNEDSWHGEEGVWASSAGLRGIAAEEEAARTRLSELKAQVENTQRVVAATIAQERDAFLRARDAVAQLKRETEALGDAVRKRAAAREAVDEAWAVAQVAKDAAAGKVLAGTCSVCLGERVPLSVLAPCGHACVCKGCSVTIAAGGIKCPMCRAPVESVVHRIFQSS